MFTVSEEEVVADMANITAVVLDLLVLWNQTEPMDDCLGLYAFSVIPRFYIYWDLG